MFAFWQSTTNHFERMIEPRSLLDIALVFVIVYAVLRLIRGTRAVPMAAGLAAIGLLYWVAVKYSLTTLEWILQGGLLYVGVAIIVLFQNEIRQVLTQVGNRVRMPLTRPTRGSFGEGAYDEVVLAATSLASTKTGALIVIERDVGLKNVIDGGVKLNAELSYDLLVTIFNPATPLHDGAVVVRDHRIAAASCFMPLTLNPLLAKNLGTRHRAAIGITEDTDAVAVVVSEETGLISFVEGGQMKRGLEATGLRTLILEAVANPRGRAKRKRASQPETTEKETSAEAIKVS